MASSGAGRCCARAKERARERERESGEAQLATEEEAGAAGQTWWPTRVRPPRRMRATRRPSSAGSPRRHGAAVRTWTWARARGGETRRWAGPASASGPEARPRPTSAPLSLFHFFEFLFPKSLNEIFEALANFSGVGVKRRIVPHKILYNLALRCKFKFQTEFESQIKTSSRFLNKFILGIFL